jgi:CheY-like chemotaxis protein
MTKGVHARAEAPAGSRFGTDVYRSADDAHAPDTTHAPDATIEVGAFDGVRLLLVEDDPIGRESLETIFSHYGAEVMSADSMGAALDLYEKHMPSLVVSDIGLRQGDGYMLLRAIRARERRAGRRIPAIAISGFPSAEIGDGARQAGFDALVRKPIELRGLLTLAHTLLAA